MIAALFLLSLALPPQELGAATAELSSADPVIRAHGACLARDLGTAAASAIPRLAALLADGSPVPDDVCGDRSWRGMGHDDHVSTPGEQAAGALAAMGSAAYDALAAAVKGTSWIARKNAAWALGVLRDGRAAPLLATALRDPEPPVRASSAWALGVLRSHDAIDPLMTALKDADADVRSQAAWSLGVLRARTAVTALTGALKDTDPRVRRQAAWAIGVIGG